MLYLTDPEPAEKFMRGVIGLCRQPAGRALLRTGLQDRRWVTTLRILGPHFPDRDPGRQHDQVVRAACLVAGLYADQSPGSRSDLPTGAERGLGQSLGLAVASGHNRNSAEATLTRLTTARDLPTLCRHLPAAVLPMRGNNRSVPVHWIRLLRDVAGTRSPAWRESTAIRWWSAYSTLIVPDRDLGDDL